MRNLVTEVAGAACQLEEVKPQEYEVMAEEAALVDGLDAGDGEESESGSGSEEARAKQVQALTDLFELYDVDEPNMDGKEKK